MDSLPPSSLDTWTFRRVMWATLLLVFVALGFWLLYRFYQVIFIVFIAILMGTVIRPVITWLNKRGIPRVAGFIFISILLLILFIGFMLLLFPMVMDQGSTIVADVPGYYQNLRLWLANTGNPMIVGLGDFLPATLPNLAPIQQTGQQALASAEQAMGYVTSGARFIFIILAVLLLAFHWTLDGPQTIQSWLLLLPKDQRSSIGEMISAMESKVGSFLAGQGVLCLSIGIMALIAYLIIGLPNALILALIAGVLEAVPMIGPFLGAIPAALIALSISPSKLVWVILATVIIQQLENNLLVPRVMRKAVGVNPFVSLLAIFSFSTFFGIMGALVAIPFAAIIQILLDRFLFRPGTVEPEDSTGRDSASRLRYDAQTLAQGLRRQARFTKRGSVQRVKQVDKIMDEIETITTDLDALLAEVPPTGKP
jgi:predicted PurR-regulated permease PerM